MLCLIFGEVDGDGEDSDIVDSSLCVDYNRLNPVTVRGMLRCGRFVMPNTLFARASLIKLTMVKSFINISFDLLIMYPSHDQDMFADLRLSFRLASTISS